MNVKVTADSTCDLSPALLARYDITLAPLTVIKDGTSYTDGLTITPQEIFQPRGRRWQPLFHGGGKRGGNTRPFSAGSPGPVTGLSTSPLAPAFPPAIRTPVWRQQDFPMSGWWIPATSPQARGHVVLEACRLRDQAASLDGLCQELAQLTGKVEASFLLNRLDYMVKGGRCSTVAALGANLFEPEALH